MLNYYDKFIGIFNFDLSKVPNRFILLSQQLSTLKLNIKSLYKNKNTNVLYFSLHKSN